METNILARLKRTPHINGSSIAQFFGGPLQYAIRQRIKQDQPTQATPYQTTSNRNVEQFIAALHFELQGNIPDSDVQKIKQSVRSCRQADLIGCTKNIILEIAEKQLTECKQRLQRQIRNRQKLETAITTTRRELVSRIERMDHIDGKALRTFFGNNLEEKILENTDDIVCPICYEYFAEEFFLNAAGVDVVHRITLRCGHHVCEQCASQIHECPKNCDR